MILASLGQGCDVLALVFFECRHGGTAFYCCKYITFCLSQYPLLQINDKEIIDFGVS